MGTEKLQCFVFYEEKNSELVRIIPNTTAIAKWIFRLFMHAKLEWGSSRVQRNLICIGDWLTDWVSQLLLPLPLNPFCSCRYFLSLVSKQSYFILRAIYTYSSCSLSSAWRWYLYKHNERRIRVRRKWKFYLITSIYFPLFATNDMKRLPKAFSAVENRACQYGRTGSIGGVVPLRLSFGKVLTVTHSSAV